MRPALRTILVVDDDESILGFVVRILKNANFNVLSAPAGSDALHLAATTSSRIDLLVSDVDMPHMTGPELVGAFRPTRPDLKVLLMSGSADGNALSGKYGCAFIQKPFTPTQLVSIVNDLLT